MICKHLLVFCKLYILSPDKREVTIAYRSLMNPEICRNMVEAQVKGVLTSTSIDRDVEFLGCDYPGRVFKLGNIPQNYLEEVIGTHRVFKR